MKRRDFVHLTSLGAGIAWLPGLRRSRVVRQPDSHSCRRPEAAGRRGARAARAAGATYADVRIGRYLNQFINARDTKIQGITNTESFGSASG